MADEVAEGPERGTRPRNRRELIIAAATDLFHRHGYEAVSMNMVADAVNVSPSALYRHFRGKPQLLTAAVTNEMEPFRETIAEVRGADLDTVTRSLARTATEHDRLGVLWVREARGLPAEQYGLLRGEVSRSMRLIASMIADRRPDLDERGSRLLARGLCSAMTVTSSRRPTLSASRRQQVLQEVLLSIAELTPAPAEGEGAPARLPTGLVPTARRERLLAGALALFAEHGYPAVGIDDIRHRAGLSTSSVYREFESKRDLLAALLHRGDEWLRHDMHRALRGAWDPADGLRRLLASYVDFVARHHDYVTVLLCDSRHCEGSDRERTRRTQREYVGEWVTLVLASVPGMTEAEAEVRVAIVLNVANDIARTPGPRERPETWRTLRRLGRAVLLPERRSG
ncbi:TetR/AcrR family transcriptional regulator [Nocardiopsis sp. NPDC007018]|uniref:TetR/AcrR family transcriptional regulator n=1 Tax=Nocardiopsis sp. NPDC007018 TaxID=3155721 RepID=UPI0033CF1747